MTNPFSLADQVAIVTGSSRGIGRAIAEAMSQLGAKVVISSRKTEACEAVAKDIRDRGGEAIVFPTRERPVAGTRGVYRAQLRHGVSRLRSGERTTLGVIFHDAR